MLPVPTPWILRHYARRNLSATMNNYMKTMSLELLCDIQRDLSHALNSLEGKQIRSRLDRYLFYMAVHINRAAEGYVFLRKASKLDTSRLLIRPGIEAMIRVLAVRKDASLLYRIAYTEGLEDRKWARPSFIKAGKDYDSEDKKAWKDFTNEYAAEFPTHKLEEKELTLFEAATTAGALPYYNAYYRLYLQVHSRSILSSNGEPRLYPKCNAV